MGQSLIALQLFHSIVLLTCHDFSLYCTGAVLLENAVAMFAGLLMGVGSAGQGYQGVLVHPVRSALAKLAS